MKVRGEYLLQAPKDWGGVSVIAKDAAPEEQSCEPRSMVLADPPPACQRDLRLDPEDKVSVDESDWCYSSAVLSLFFYPRECHSRLVDFSAYCW